MHEANDIPANSGTRVLSVNQIDEVDRLLDKLEWLSSVAGLVAAHIDERDAQALGLVGVLRAVNLLDAETESTADQLREIVGTPRHP